MEIQSPKKNTIIIDTREQKPLTFPNNPTIRQKIDEGDYNMNPWLPIVVERKSLEDFYGSITRDHARFKREILRAQAKNIPFYIFLEGDLKTFFSLSWSSRALDIKPETLKKIVNTMKDRYKIIIIECKTRDEMSKKIVELLEENIELNKEMKTW